MYGNRAVKVYIGPKQALKHYRDQRSVQMTAEAWAKSSAMILGKNT